jgi:hypothetical protein
MIIVSCVFQMSHQQCELACHLIANTFGENVSKVAKYLIDWKKSDLSGIKVDKAPECLAVLIQHNFVTYEKKVGPLMNYTLDVDLVLDILQHPKYLNIVNESLGSNGEVILKEILSHGRLSASNAIKSIIKREFKGVDSRPDNRIKELWKAFSDLADANFICRCDTSQPAKDPLGPKESFTLPTLSVQELIVLCDGKTASKATDGLVLWKANRLKFLSTFRDEALIFAVRRRIDASGGRLMKTCLGLTNACWDDKVSGTFSHDRT